MSRDSAHELRVLRGRVEGETITGIYREFDEKRRGRKRLLATLRNR